MARPKVLTSAITAALLTVGNAQDYCALVMNSSIDTYSWARINNVTGAITPDIFLPELDSFGDSISAGAAYGRYYTVSGNVSEQEEMLVVDTVSGKHGYITLQLPPAYSDVTLYGVGSLNTDAGSSLPLALVLGYTAGGQRRAFVGLVDDATGKVTKVLTDLTAAYSSWVFLYAGVSAWDPAHSLYYLSAVTGSRDITYLYAFNTSIGQGQPGAGQPVITQPVTWGVGAYTALAVSPALSAQHPGSLGLVALVVDDNDAAAALWLLGDTSAQAQGQEAAPAPWIQLYQFSDDTLAFAGNNQLELSSDGTRAYVVFYDNHTPIANQVVISVDLVQGKEVGRTVVQGSEEGTAIADIALCPGQ